jgi:hypothetical protein
MILRASMVSLLALGLAGANAAAQTRPRARPAAHSVVIRNASPRQIDALRVSPSAASQWGADQLGDNVLEAGHSITVPLPGTGCRYDFRARYHNGAAEEMRNIDICANRQVAFDGSGAHGAATGNGHDITIFNHTPREIDEIHISAHGDSDWGDDLLADDTLAAGATKQTQYHGGCQQDIRIIYDNHSAEERRDANLCEHTRIEIKPGWTLPDALGGSSEGTEPDAPDPRADERKGIQRIKAVVPAN